MGSLWTVLQYDAVPIQSSVVLCACPSPSMVRTQTESGSATGIPSSGSRQGPTMDGTTAEARPSTNPLQHTAQPPQPRKKRPEDFKFGKILGEGSFSTVVLARELATSREYATRANSFVGTAQYVSPELLTEKSACKSSDLWALGCIIYQLVAGLPPFRAGNEYLIFQKIIKLEYDFPEKFFPKARDLVEKLLVLDATKRLGCEEMEGYEPLKAHPFFESITWENLHQQTPPKLTAYLPAMSEDDEDCYGNYDNLLSQFGCMQVSSSSSSHSLSVADAGLPHRSGSNIEQYIHDLDTNSFELDLQFSEDEKRLLLEKQAGGNPWHQFVENNLILKMGPVDKRKGLFARRRQLLLTEGPHLYYVDPVNKVLKGEIPWSQELRPEAKNFKTFFVHTPNRTYYLMDPSGNAHKWCRKIQEVWRQRYQSHPDAAVQ
ncbi:3-phosphoinositide-dependent protein kinase 1 isoform X5 [Sciurus carolinensis]|uniref:3-phosphoinositide-dependent protein kinase 1 isoform X5 n=1 Tax=Sciurus carolinensis TaxID=30640 RepID=UPI001FB320F5|nr:3-phosphoinositide-dependent protein kinase 1 isoform X5 [Sciurus carolinensis]